MQSHCSRTILSLAVALLTLAAGPAAATGPTVASASTGVTVMQDTKMKDLDPIFQQLFLPNQGQDVNLTAILQLFPIDPTELGLQRAKGKATMNWGCAGNGVTRASGSMTRKFDSLGNAVFDRKFDASLNCDLFFLDFDFKGKRTYPEGNSINVVTSLDLISPDALADCFDPNALCLDDDRFRVEVEWRDLAGSSGDAVAFPRTDDSGVFYFFDPNNWELLIKVLDGCAVNDHFWVFYGATTNVEYEVKVTDTERGVEKTYFNTLGTAAPPIQDTRAFATCP